MQDFQAFAEGAMQFGIDEIEGLFELLDKGAGALKGAIDIFDRIKQVRERKKAVADAEVDTLVLQLMGEVKDAQLANVSLKAQLLLVHEKAALQQRLSAEFDRYALWKSPAGALVYRLKDDRADEEPLHYLCPACKEAGRKSILQGHEEAVQCLPCSHWFRLQTDDGVYKASSRRRGDLFD